jgi:hypothetical protein
MEGLGQQQRLLIANPQAAQLRIPRVRALHDPARFAQAPAMRLAGRSQLGLHPALATLLTVGRRAIGAVPLPARGACPGAPAPALHRREGLAQRDRLKGVAGVGGSEVQGQGRPLALGEYLAFEAPCGAVRGVGPRVGPPKTARLEALSMMARDQSMPPAYPSSSRR